MWSISRLKDKVHGIWSLGTDPSNSYPDDRDFSAPGSDAAFKSEMRKFGDLRRKSTWSNAFVELEAKSLIAFGVAWEGQMLIETFLIEMPRQEGWTDLAPLVTEKLLSIPETFKSLAEGLQGYLQYGPSYGDVTPEELKNLFRKEQLEILKSYVETLQDKEQQRTGSHTF